MAGDPARRGVGVEGLEPVERRCRVAQLALAPVVGALAAPDPPEIEPEGRESPAAERVKQGVDHLVVHRSAVLRVGMQEQRDGGVGLLAVNIPAFDPSGRSIDHYFRHCGVGPGENRLAHT